MGFTFNIDMAPTKAFTLLWFRAYRKHRKEWFKNLRDAGNLLRREATGKLRSGTAGPERQTGTIIRHHQVRITRVPGTDRAERTYDLKVGPLPGGKAYYAKFHELGVANRRPGGTLIGQPWLAPTLAEKEGAVHKILGRSLRHIQDIG